MTRSGILLAIAALATGCPPPTCEDAAAVEPSLTIGVGEKGFSELLDGDTVAFDSGPQGGQHIWVGVQTTGVLPGESNGENAPQVRYWLLADGGTVVGEGSRNWSLKGGVDDAWIFGDTLFIDFFDPAEYSDYSVRAELIDACDTTLLTEVSVNLPP